MRRPAVVKGETTRLAPTILSLRTVSSSLARADNDRQVTIETLGLEYHETQRRHLGDRLSER